MSKLTEQATKCPWYSKGFCKIDEKPCPYDNDTYKECPKFNHSERYMVKETVTMIESIATGKSTAKQVANRMETW